MRSCPLARRARPPGGLHHRMRSEFLLRLRLPTLARRRAASERRAAYASSRLQARARALREDLLDELLAHPLQSLSPLGRDVLPRAVERVSDALQLCVGERASPLLVSERTLEVVLRTGHPAALPPAVEGEPLPLVMRADLLEVRLIGLGCGLTCSRLG